LNLSDIGRIFYGIAIAGLGFQTIYAHDFPYMLIPPKHIWIPGFVIISSISGALLMLAGACIMFKIKTRSTTLLLGTVLLFIFCFYFIPYEFFATSKYMQFLEWDNAEKELALSSGAFIIAGCFSEKGENPLFRFLMKLIPLGHIIFSFTMISFGFLHLLYGEGVLEYAPAWVPRHLFWAYFPGIVLISSGFAIMLNIKRSLMAALLGVMIFTWFIVLHIPKVIASPVVVGGELTSAFLALAYSGIAFVIAGVSKKQQVNFER
jgi:hypothetical protein